MSYKSMLRPLIILLCTLSSYGNIIIAQDADSTILSKGRIFTSLFGSLSNKQVDISVDETAGTTGYTLGTKSGYFFMNRFVMGVNFSLSRYEYENPTIKFSSENLLIGFWNRFYILEIESAALHAEITPYFAATYQQNHVLNSNGVVISNESLSGNGFGLEPGFGFTYFVNRHVGFGITITYSWAKLNVSREDILFNQKTFETYYINQLGLIFNFQIYID